MSGDPETREDCPPDLPAAPPGAIVKNLPIVNQRGLHARASAKFVQTVERFDAEVRVTRCGETVGGTSIMGTDDARRRPWHLDYGDRQRQRVFRGYGRLGSPGGQPVRRRRLKLSGLAGPIRCLRLPGGHLIMT
jgi:hypothetical protein